MSKTINIDGQIVPFEDGQTIIEAATAAGIYIPHLCHKPGYTPHGSCKLCTVNVNGRNCSACTFPAAEGQTIINNSQELTQDRQKITQMLFVEGNHMCPSCEKSGNCQLQAVAYYLNMLDNHYPLFFPQRNVDATHPDVLLDRNRCIFCNLCVRASQEHDGKNVFGISGRGINKQLVINSASGTLQDSGIAINDSAMHVCPTGALLPIGQRTYDHQAINEIALEQEQNQ